MTWVCNAMTTSDRVCGEDDFDQEYVMEYSDVFYVGACHSGFGGWKSNRIIFFGVGWVMSLSFIEWNGSQFVVQS